MSRAAHTRAAADTADSTDIAASCAPIPRPSTSSSMASPSLTSQSNDRVVPQPRRRCPLAAALRRAAPATTPTSTAASSADLSERADSGLSKAHASQGQPLHQTRGPDRGESGIHERGTTEGHQPRPGDASAANVPLASGDESADIAGLEHHSNIRCSVAADLRARRRAPARRGVSDHGLRPSSLATRFPAAVPVAAHQDRRADLRLERAGHREPRSPSLVAEAHRGRAARARRSRPRPFRTCCVDGTGARLRLSSRLFYAPQDVLPPDGNSARCTASTASCSRH
jgi:hypothetical protein